MFRAQKIVLVALTALVAAAPLFALAWAPGDPLVPCGREDQDLCTLCHLFVLGQNILGFLMWVAAPLIAILVIAWGGFKILISGTNPGLRQDGIRIIKNTLWGLLIVFGAWIVINELLIFFAGGQTLQGLLLPWNEISCLPPPS